MIARCCRKVSLRACERSTSLWRALEGLWGLVIPLRWLCLVASILGRIRGLRRLVGSRNRRPIRLLRHRWSLVRLISVRGSDWLRSLVERNRLAWTSQRMMWIHWSRRAIRRVWLVVRLLGNRWSVLLVLLIWRKLRLYWTESRLELGNRKCLTGVLLIRLWRRCYWCWPETAKVFVNISSRQSSEITMKHPDTEVLSSSYLE